MEKLFKEEIGVKAEWIFEYEDGRIEGPFSNSFPADGLTMVAELLSGASSPYLVVGDDIAEGYAITEAYRKPVSVVTQSGAVVRFRTQLLQSECNGDHQKACIYLYAADSSGTGRMLNMLRRAWSKADSILLTVECRITVQEVTS